MTDDDAQWSGWEEWRSDAFYPVVDWAAEYLDIIDDRALNLLQSAVAKSSPKLAQRLKKEPELLVTATVFGALAVLLSIRRRDRG
jgi:hypothetical protein